MFDRPIWPAVAHCPTVLARHTLPDGSSHIDWFMARDPQAVGPLLSFRLAVRLDESLPGRPLRAEWIGDHRPLYIAYEGEVSDNRGRVDLLAHGVVDQSTPDASETRLRISWRERSISQCLVVRATSDPIWWEVIVQEVENVVTMT